MAEEEGGHTFSENIMRHLEADEFFFFCFFISVLSVNSVAKSQCLCVSVVMISIS